MPSKKKQRKDKKNRASEAIKNIKIDIFCFILLLGIIICMMGIYYWTMAHLALVLTIMGSIIFIALTILSIIYSDFVKHTFIHTLKGLNYYSALQQSYQEREQREKQHLKTNDGLGHPLSEYNISFLKLYLQGISFMHPKFPAIMEGVAFHDLAESLGVSNIVFQRYSKRLHSMMKLADMKFLFNCIKHQMPYLFHASSVISHGSLLKTTQMAIFRNVGKKCT